MTSPAVVEMSLLTCLMLLILPTVGNGFCRIAEPVLLDDVRASSRQSLSLPVCFATPSASAYYPSKDWTPNNQGVTGVTLKLAFDRNYAVADLSEHKFERFTSPESLDLVHRLRRASDAVLVGKTTVECDNCSLTVRRVPLLQDTQHQIQPTRVVIDPSLSLVLHTADDASYALFHDGLPTILYYGGSHGLTLNMLKASERLPHSVTLVPVQITTNSNTLVPKCTLSTHAMLKDMRELGLHHVMVEGGPATARAFLEDKVVDRAIIIKANVTFQEPLQSMMNDDTLLSAGLRLLGTAMSEGDTVEFWSRANLAWPAAELSQWP